MHLPKIDDIVAARERIGSRIRRTPLIRSDWLSDLSGGGVYLKLESLQVTRSFKARGALNAVLALGARAGLGAAPPAIVTASAGNHGRAMAWAARHAGMRVTVFTPREAPVSKLDAIRTLGADLRPVAESYDDAERLARKHARDTGCPFISPYNHPDLLTAIGTIALEIAEDLPHVDQVVVPVGGGGLIAGIAAGLHAVASTTRVVGVEVEASHAFTAALAAGRIVPIAVGPTLADGLAGNMEDDNLAFPIVQALVERVVLVGEEALREGIRGLVGHERLIAEGAGIVGVSAILSGRVTGAGRETVVVVSGANIDVERLVDILAPPAGIC